MLETLIEYRRRSSPRRFVPVAILTFIVAVAFLALVAENARAAVLPHDVSPGSFGFSVVAPPPTNPAATLSSQGADETWSDGCTAANGPMLSCAATPSDGEVLSVAFAQPLALDVVDPLLETGNADCRCDERAGEVGTDAARGTTPGTIIAGSADAASVPEAVVLATLAMAFGMLGLARRRNGAGRLSPPILSFPLKGGRNAVAASRIYSLPP